MVRKYRVGRFKIDSDLGSQDNYTMAKSWIEGCCKLHRNCPRKQVAKLPTRVIDVGLLDSQQSPRLVLSQGTEAKYATLSHCWGGEISPLLTQETLNSFRHAIPLSDLPANFRDAIFITRGIGIQYLWIDSLCIIQDSRADWEAESKTMGSIYRDALVTISAATACRSTDGIIKGPSDSGIAEESISPRLPIDNESNKMVQVSLKREEESMRELFLRSPLMKRGWTLQEAILSPRILWYGHQLFWQCPQGFQSADGVPPGTLMPEDSAYTEIVNVIHSLNQTDGKAPDLNLVLDDYYNLVRDYSSRTLSYNSDKFPAFSGLAALLHPILGGEYLAGIWSMDFRKGLIWYKETRDCRHTLPSQAPSWSWAVTNGPVLFWFTTRKETTSPNDAQLIDHKVELKSQNVYGQVDSGHLVINGLTKKLFRSSQLVNFCNHGIAQVFFDEAESDSTTFKFSNLFEVRIENRDYFL